METWLVGIIVGAFELVITTVIGLALNSWWTKRTKDRDELAKLREKEREEADNQRCLLMKKAVHDEFAPVLEDVELMKKAMQKDIRRSLRQDAKFFKDRGYASHQEKTEFDELYWVYHNLGKNGVVDKDHDIIMNLPEEPNK